MPWLERVYAWSFRTIFKSNFASQAVTAFGYPFALAFEWYAWRQLRQRILAGLWSLAGETLGGLTAPRTFVREGRNPDLRCFFVMKLTDRSWTAPRGSDLICRA